MDESLRARKDAGKTRQEAPLLVYFWPKYLNGSVYLSATDLNHSLAIPYASCADGLVIWGDRLNAADAAFWCVAIPSCLRPNCIFQTNRDKSLAWGRHYTESVFAPAMKELEGPGRNCDAAVL